MDSSLGKRSTATFMKLPTKAPITKARIISMGSAFPKSQGDGEVVAQEIISKHWEDGGTLSKVLTLYAV
jgi:hypothetical protein